MVANLANVKIALGVTGTYQDATLQVYFDEVVGFLKDAGISESLITSGLVTLGTPYHLPGSTELKMEPSSAQSL